MTDLLVEVQALGWQRGWFEYAKREVSLGRSIDDSRAADWIYLVRADAHSRVLISGPQLLVTAAALADRVGEVWLAAADPAEARVLDEWRRQMHRANVHLVEADLASGIPFPDPTFDLVSVRAGFGQPAPHPTRGFADLARDVMRVLRPGGTARFVADNRFFPARRADAPAGGRFRAHSIGGYRRILRRLRFTNIQFFAPLPRHTRTPLCLLPLESRAALDVFMRDLFPVFATVSPEVKQAHALEYALAHAGVWTMTRANLAGLMKFLVPGYTIFAERAAADAA